MSDLFEEIRRRASAEAWSKGVTLARHGAVSLESEDAEEISARVAIPGAPVTPRVSLYPEDVEWECDCESPLDACEHVAAVVIARRQGRPTATRSTPLEYRFRRSPEGLHLERGVEDDKGFHPIEAPLEAIASGRLSGPAFDASPEDLEIERALRGTLRGVLDRSAVPRAFEALSRASKVSLDGRPVGISSAPVIRPVVVEDAAGEGFVLRFGESREVGERFRNGIVLAGETLRPEAEPELTGREWEELRRGRIYRPEEVGLLVGEVLPSLKQRVPVEVRTVRLPGAVREEPRLWMRFEREGDRLYVLPGIVYGRPPLARVEGGRLVALRGEVPLRNLEGERCLSDALLRRFGLTLDRGEELETEDAIELVTKLGDTDVAVEGDAHEGFRLAGRLEPRVVVGDYDLDVSFEAAGRSADLSTVLRAFRDGRSLVSLVDSGFAELPTDWLERYGDRIEDLLAAREASGKLSRASSFDLDRLAIDLEIPRRPPARPEAKAPARIHGELRGYQKIGVEWLSFHRTEGLGALLADDMGLGKTVQALAVLDGRSLVAAPTSVLRNWIEEARRFRPDLSLCLYHGPDRKLDPRAHLTVASHAILRLDREVFAGISWDAVVIDEAQALRNPETQLAQAANALDARFRLALTGTPIENRLTDLWSLFRFLNPGFLGSLSSFEERYVRPVEKGEREPLERLRERIAPFFLRRLKSEVAPELPPRTESTLYAELSEPERELYDALRLAARKDVLDRLGKGGSVLAALEALLRLRQAACHPALVPGQQATSSSKTEVLLEALETARSEDQKSLVFSQWTSLLDLLEPHLEERGYPFVRLDGSTRDRASVVERFQTDPDVSVFLVSLKAGGTGLNLTAADHVFLFDPWWNPAVEEQAFDRAHRIGREKPVFVYRLVAQDTVEERILDLQREKRALAEITAPGTASVLGREDLLRLLE